MWNQARQVVSMISATVSGLELIGGLARQTDRPKEALAMIASIVTGLIEGFQGRIAARDLDNALVMLKTELLAAEGIPTSIILEKFKAAL